MPVLSQKEVRQSLRDLTHEPPLPDGTEGTDPAEHGRHPSWSGPRIPGGEELWAHESSCWRRSPSDLNCRRERIGRRSANRASEFRSNRAARRCVARVRLVCHEAEPILAIATSGISTTASMARNTGTSSPDWTRSVRGGAVTRENAELQRQEQALLPRKAPDRSDSLRESLAVHFLSPARPIPFVERHASMAAPK